MTLLLLPNLIGDHRHHQPFLPASIDKAVSTLDGLIAESVTAGRRFLGRFETKKPAHEIPIAIYDKKTPDEDLDFLLEPIRKGERWGLVSDAGLPCIADPGSKLVLRAKQTGIAVQSFVGPSSIFLALMGSGLPGQRFAFNGYLDKDLSKKKKQILLLEKRAKEEDSTQIFMETPYRNVETLAALLEVLNDKTYLAVAWDLTLTGQGNVTYPVQIWKKNPLPNLEKRNALFLIGPG